MDYKKLEFKEFPEGTLPKNYVGSGKPIISPGKLGQPNSRTAIYKLIFVILFFSGSAFVAICFALSGSESGRSVSGYEGDPFMPMCRGQPGLSPDDAFHLEGTIISRLRAFIIECRTAGAVVMLLPKKTKCPPASQTIKEHLQEISKGIQHELKENKVTLADLGFLPSYDIHLHSNSHDNDLQAVPDSYIAYVRVTYVDRVLVVGPIIGETPEDAKDAVDREALRGVLQVIYKIPDDGEVITVRMLEGQELLLRKDEQQASEVAADRKQL